MKIFAEKVQCQEIMYAALSSLNLLVSDKLSNKDNLEAKVSESMKAQQYDAALGFIEEMLKKDDSSKWLILKANCLMQIGKVADACDFVAKVLQDEPTNVEALDIIGSNRKAIEAEIFARMADKKFEWCVALLDKMLQIEVDRQLIMAKAVCLANLGKVDKADAIAEEVLGENPSDAEAHFVAALCRYQEGKLSLSIEMFNKIIAGNPKPLNVLKTVREERDKVSRLLVLLQKGQRNFKRSEYRHALDKFTEALKLASGNKRVTATVHINRGMARKSINLFELALLDFDAAMELYSGDLLIHHRRVRCLYECCRYEECQAECIEALKLQECKLVSKLLKKTQKKLKKQRSLDREFIPLHNIKCAIGLH